MREPGALFSHDGVHAHGRHLLLIWLSNQITARGIGNGLALILAVGLMSICRQTSPWRCNEARQGYVSVDMIVAGASLAVMITAFIVLVEGARRVITVDYPAQTDRRRDA